MTLYSSRYASQQKISKFKTPKEGAPADAVHQMLKDELDLDGRPNLNLASFVGTYMEREAEALVVENLSKNMSDADEHPAMMAVYVFLELGILDYRQKEPEVGHILKSASLKTHCKRLEIFFQ